MALSVRNQRRIVLLLAAGCLACAPAPRMGEAVDIVEESAIIIWDEAAKTQHFIRRASFRTTAKDFGFLVPTPTVPELKEADDRAFSLLEELTAPKIVKRNIPRNAKAALPAAAAAAPRVSVVASAKVAGYDAVVLEANDAVALNDWLNKHGYASTPDLIDWFRPYLERNWKISAFKIDRDAQGNEASARAVRMSFKTEAPFFPYREPVTQHPRADSRMLRTFVFASSRVDGKLGTAGNWPGRTVWSDRIEEKDYERLLVQVGLPARTAAGALWLTEFEDGSAPRPGTDDVFFASSSNQSTVKRPNHIVYVRSDEPNPEDYVIWGIGLLLLAGFLYVAYRIGRSIFRSRAKP